MEEFEETESNCMEKALKKYKKQRQKGWDRERLGSFNKLLMSKKVPFTLSEEVAFKEGYLEGLVFAIKQYKKKQN